jgi:hypothetical protein
MPFQGISNKGIKIEFWAWDRVGVLLGTFGMIYIGFITWYGMDTACKLGNQKRMHSDKIEGLGLVIYGKPQYLVWKMMDFASIRSDWLLALHCL